MGGADVKKVTGASFLAVLVVALSVCGSVLGSYIFLDERDDNQDSRIGNIETSVAVIEGNRFTVADGQRITANTLELWKEIASVRQEISRVREEMAALPKEVPPEWFLDQFKALQEKMDEVIGRQLLLDARMVQLENK